MKEEDLGFSPFDKEMIDKVLSNELKYWTVDEQGDISRKDRNYEISHQRLTDINWLDQILSKNEKNAEQEFYFVFIEALRRAGYKTVTIDLENPTNKIVAK